MERLRAHPSHRDASPRVRAPRRAAPQRAPSLALLFALSSVVASGCFVDVIEDPVETSASDAADQDGEASGSSTGFVPTEADCPGDSALTWTNFADDFFDFYCRGCHSVEVEGADRNGAPVGVNWDTLAEVEARAAQIDRLAGAHGDIVNDFMPPVFVDGIVFPSRAEREDLAQWIACDLPE